MTRARDATTTDPETADALAAVAEGEFDDAMPLRITPLGRDLLETVREVHASPASVEES